MFWNSSNLARFMDGLELFMQVWISCLHIHVKKLCLVRCCGLCACGILFQPMASGFDCLEMRGDLESEFMKKFPSPNLLEQSRSFY